MNSIGPRLVAVFLLLLLAAGCGPQATTDVEFGTQMVAFPNGQKIRAEVVFKPEDMMRGMMFRDSLPRDRGMLFVHSKPGNYPYWMYQVKIPLDMIWMDTSRRIVEIVESAPPCRTKASACPSYGGTKPARFVLEIGSGEAKRYGLRAGDILTF